MRKEWKTWFEQLGVSASTIWSTCSHSTKNGYSSLQTNSASMLSLTIRILSFRAALPKSCHCCPRSGNLSLGAKVPSRWRESRAITYSISSSRSVTWAGAQNIYSLRTKTPLWSCSEAQRTSFWPVFRLGWVPMSLSMVACYLHGRLRFCKCSKYLKRFTRGRYHQRCLAHQRNFWPCSKSSRQKH